MATPNGFRKLVISVMIPLMVASGVSTVPELAFAQATTPDPAQPDTYSTPLKQPEYRQTNRYDKTDIPVQLLGINDLHGGLDTTGTAYIGSHPYPNTGTVGRLAAYLDQAQHQFKRVHHSNNTFRIEAGDMVGAAPADSSLLAHESTMHALRAMKFQIGTLGNHEFDRGLPEFNRILRGRAASASADPLVKNYPNEPTKMKIVVSNVVNRSNGKVPFGYQPYMVRTIKAHGKTAKIGFIGLEIGSLTSITPAKNTANYKILDEAQSIAKYDRILNKQGVKAVVVMAHTAVQTRDGKTTGPVVDILHKLNRIDPKNNVGLYVAAHSHQYANAMVGKTRVVQALFSGRAYDDAQAYVSPKTGKFVDLKAHVYPVLSAKADAKVKSVAQVAAIAKDADKRVGPKVNVIIGKAASSQPITDYHSNTKTMENQIGETVVDGQLYEANKPGGVRADFALTNNGGVRADLTPNAQGQITWGAAMAVQPFGNILQVVEMTGQQIQDALNEQYSNPAFYLQIAGLKYTYTDNPGSQQHYKVLKMYKTDGTPLNLTTKYRVAINDYIHGGGDDFFAFKNTPVVGSIGSDSDVFVQYIKDMAAANHPLTAPKPDRKLYQATGTTITVPAPSVTATK
ncbi:bifunctional metallophosphatase/5'-nucleotidase [Levilactobacillus acidifarinae]|uniref:5-nucleotidase n=1 Tax=Levilactobacillus acidifarinae DSM 19394 = JCM 15949 TaxID=1423715 RepID=A0A0R1LQI2_9LACO|nr:bifunctional metallophosphatase/5'-nucleotidase [Levilactobacillus acidifarinae]KRK95396.1 5-nucleotidase [Levilactobacillus acidifarinae DSM 19394]GEO70011.1 bifunctional metallophosphatase/5'-nucleotidase [Levilactobacillus acidifarinae]